MCHHPHGVAEIDFGDMDTAVGAEHEVDSERAVIAVPNVGSQPWLDAFTSLTNGKSSLNLCVSPENIFFIQSTTCLKVAIPKEHTIHIFQRHISHRTKGKDGTEPSPTDVQRAARI